MARNIGSMATFCESPEQPGPRLNWQLIILVCGLSLSVGVAGSTGILSPPVPSPPAGSVQPPVPPPDSPGTTRIVPAPVMTYVLLDSQADANALRATIAAYAADEGGLAREYDWTDLVVLDSRDAEDAFWMTFHRTFVDLEAAGTRLRIIDLRE